MTEVKVVWVDEKIYKQILDSVNSKGEVAIESRGFKAIILKVVGK